MEGRPVTTAVAVGDVSWEYLYPSATSEAIVVVAGLDASLGEAHSI
jgi:hypothetical protein